MTGPPPVNGGGAAAAAAAMTAPSLSTRAVRHTIWNLAGVLLPFVIGLLAMPVLTRSLGPARFGILGLAWTLLEYFSLFDAGLGRATVRAVAGERAVMSVPGRAGREAPAARALSATVTGAVALQVALGAAAGLLFAIGAPAIVERMLGVPPELAAEGVSAMRVLAATVPVLMLSLALRGLLEAGERFDLSNAIRMPVTAGTFLLPAAIAVAGGALPAMLVALLGLRIVAVVAQLVAVRYALPAFRWRRPRQWSALRELLAFGGWVAVSNFVSPVLVYLDRIIVGTILGVVALGYYTAPFEATLRLLVVPAALVATLYPMASALIASGDMDAMRRLYSGAVRALTVALIGVAAVGIILAPELLTAWLGADYAERSATALRILCVGVLVNAIVHVPFSFLQAAGRPELMARFHLIELALHVPATLWLVGRFGIAGAAMAWTLRALLDAALVFGAAGRVLDVGAARLADGRAWRAVLLLGFLVAGLFALRALDGTLLPAESAWPVLVGAPLLAGLQAVGAWRWLLRPEEREALLLALRRRGTTAVTLEPTVVIAPPATRAR
ncbi:MAG: flippase [Gemmatimonadaceae bacterium]